MNLVSAIHEYKGKQELYIEAKPDILDAMLKIAKIQSIGASNRIEGIYTSNERLDATGRIADRGVYHQNWCRQENGIYSKYGAGTILT
jgi:hypothetical protein